MTNEEKKQQAIDLKSMDEDVRYDAVKLGNLTPEQHATALADSDWDVRVAAVTLGGLTTAQHAAALDDDDSCVWEAAVLLGGLTEEQLAPFRDDYWCVLAEAPNETAGLRLALVEGRINGQLYDGECACLIGTIANLRDVEVSRLPSAIKPNATRPAEQWFLNIQSADTPETNYLSKMAVQWLDEFVAQQNKHTTV